MYKKLANDIPLLALMCAAKKMISGSGVALLCKVPADLDLRLCCIMSRYELSFRWKQSVTLGYAQQHERIIRFSTLEFFFEKQTNKNDNNNKQTTPTALCSPSLELTNSNRQFQARKEVLLLGVSEVLKCTQTNS